MHCAHHVENHRSRRDRVQSDIEVESSLSVLSKTTQHFHRVIVFKGLIQHTSTLCCTPFSDFGALHYDSGGPKVLAHQPDSMGT